MMARKRERLGVMHDILEGIRGSGNSTLPTPLMRRANLSTQRFSEYLAELLARGFVRELVGKDGRKRYTLTDLGFEYLEKYRLIRGFIEEFDL